MQYMQVRQVGCLECTAYTLTSFYRPQNNNHKITSFFHMSCIKKLIVNTKTRACICLVSKHTLSFSKSNKNASFKYLSNFISHTYFNVVSYLVQPSNIILLSKLVVLNHYERSCHWDTERSNGMTSKLKLYHLTIVPF